MALQPVVCALFLAVSCALELDLIDWNISHSLPFNVTQSLVGYDNVTDRIWIIGGFALDGNYALSNVLTFDPNTNEFEFQSNTAIAASNGIYSPQQFSATVGRTMVFVDHKNHLQSFNMADQTYTDHLAINVTQNQPTVAAHAGNDGTYLFLTGGYASWGGGKHLFTVYKYDSTTDEWRYVSTAANMNSARFGHACIVSTVNTFLYCFGGYVYGDAFANSIEKIDVSDMSAIREKQWQTLSVALSSPITEFRVVQYQHAIYIVGGKTNSGEPVSTVQILTISEVSTGVYEEAISNAPALKQAVFQPGAVVFNDGSIFVFGGAMGETTAVRSWQKSNALTTTTTEMPTTTTTTNSMIIENHPDTQEWWVAFFLLYVDESCGSSIVNVEITDDYHYAEIWVPFDRNSIHYAFAHRDAPFTPPLSVRITVQTSNGYNETLYACDTITSLEADQQFEFGANVCDAPSSALANCTSTEIASTTTTSSSSTGSGSMIQTTEVDTDEDVSDSIIIENHQDTEEWWVAFFLLHVDESCNSSIVNVEITDNRYYRDIWLPFDRNSFEFGQYVFLRENLPFSLPLSVRITSQSAGSNETRYACDVITNFEANQQFAFGTNLCEPLSATQANCSSDTYYLVDTSAAATTGPSTADEVIYYCAVAILCLLFGCIAVVGYVHAKRGHGAHQNDLFEIATVVSALFQVLDMVSDIFFAVTVWRKWQDSHSFVFLSMFVASICFIVAPINISLYQLHAACTKYWIYDDRIRTWLSSYNKLLYITSVFTGSSFTAISIFNSNLFGLDVFYMGISNKLFMSFSTKKIYSVILFENCPQLILSISFTVLVGELTPIPLTSAIFSCISIVVAIVSLVLQKRIYEAQDYCDIKFDIIEKEVADEDKKKKYRNQVNGIRSFLCKSVFGMNTSSIQIMKPYDGDVRNGVQLRVHIAHIYNKPHANPVDYYQHLLDIAIQNGELPRVIQDEWKLSAMPRIENTNVSFTYCKKRTTRAAKQRDGTETRRLEDTAVMKQRSIEILETIPLSQ